MKEAMPCKYVLPILVLAGLGIVLINEGNLIVGISLLGFATLLSVIIGEGQIWIKKEPEKRQLYPEYSYSDYRILCERNGRKPVSGEEWNRDIRLEMPWNELK